MARLVLRRLASAIPVLLGAVTVSFVLLTLLPGDSVTAYAGTNSLTAAQRDALQERYGLDDPPLMQYFHFVGGLFRGELGTSTRNDQPVAERVAEQLRPTLELALLSTTLALLVGIAGGVLSSLTRRQWLSRLVVVGWLTALSIPPFWLGLALVTVVSFGLEWLPATGSDSWQSLILPVLTLALAPAAIVAQVVRDGLTRLEGEQFVLMAHAKGLTRAQVLLRHSLRNAMLPIVTLAGVLLGGLVSSAIVVETVFSRQGLGRLLVNAIGDQDLPVVRAVVILLAVGYVVINLLVDVLYALIDPRIRDA